MVEIRGTVSSGMGRASKAFTEKRITEVERLFGFRPYPGTVNVRVPALNAFVALLGNPAAETEPETPIGPLRWWPISVAFGPPSGDGRGPAVSVGLLVRGARTRTSYLELVFPSRLRASGLRNGDSVHVTLVAP